MYYGRNLLNIVVFECCASLLVGNWRKDCGCWVVLVVGGCLLRI